MPCKHSCLYYFLNDLNYFSRKCRKNEDASTSKNPLVRISVPKIYVSQPSSVKRSVARTNNRYVVYFTALIMHHVKAYKRCDFLSSFFISAFFLCRISCKIQFLFFFFIAFGCSMCSVTFFLLLYLIYFGKHILFTCLLQFENRYIAVVYVSYYAFIDPRGNIAPICSHTQAA